MTDPVTGVLQAERDRIDALEAESVTRLTTYADAQSDYTSHLADAEWTMNQRSVSTSTTAANYAETDPSAGDEYLTTAQAEHAQSP